MLEEPSSSSEDPAESSEGQPAEPGTETTGTQLAPAPARKMADPQRLIRIAAVTREVLEEARRISPEPAAVEHLKRVHGQICRELEDALPPELYQELDELTPEIKSGTLEELALAHAEILGWLEGLFQGTQLAIQLQALRPLAPPGSPSRSQQEERTPREGDPRYL